MGYSDAGILTAQGPGWKMSGPGPDFLSMGAGLGWDNRQWSLGHCALIRPAVERQLPVHVCQAVHSGTRSVGSPYVGFCGW